MRNAFSAHEPIDVLHLALKYLDAHKQGALEVRIIVERCLVDHGVIPESAVMSRYEQAEHRP